MINIFKRFTNWLLEVVNYIEISDNEIKNIINKICPDTTIFLMDNKYKAISKMDIQCFLKNDMTNNKKYKSEYFDCDDFAFILLARMQEYCEGIAGGLLSITKYDKTKHCLNWFIDNEKKFYLIEPQTDKVFEFPANWKINFIMR